jgi:hypothetical protein
MQLPNLHIVFTFCLAHVIHYLEGSAGRGRSRGQVPHANPPPPPPRAPVSIEDLLATQNELMRVLVRNEANCEEDRLQHHQQQDMSMSYSNFLATHPLVFFGARDRLDADDWVYTTESKFGLLHCMEYQKTLYVAQQLRGPVGPWWASYLTTLPANHHVAWDEFRIAFRGHHLSAGTIRHKLVEFLELCKGNHSMYDYTQEFNNLAQYWGHHMDNDAKKAELYCKGLNI